MIKKEMIAMLLAGGQGSRLGVLTAKVAKPAVAFGGKYRIIDFPLSNCINSGIDTVGVLTQYRPLRLNSHIGIGIPWDLDRNVGGVTVLPPYEKSTNSEWYTGTANAIYQNLEYMEQYNPEYVLILSGDHIYKMDYKIMLDYHKANNAVSFCDCSSPSTLIYALQVFKSGATSTDTTDVIGLILGSLISLRIILLSSFNTSPLMRVFLTLFLRIYSYFLIYNYITVKTI